MLESFLDPNNFSDIPARDSVQDLAFKNFGGDSNRKLLSIADVQNLPEKKAFSKLIDAGCFRAAAQLARSRLTSKNPEIINPTRVDDINRLWHIRLTCLINLKAWEIAQYEMEKIGIPLDRNIDPAVSLETLWLKKNGIAGTSNFEYYPTLFPNRTGSLVSFDLRNAHALWPSFRGNYTQSLDRLYALAFNCRRQSFLAGPVDLSIINKPDFDLEDSFLLWYINFIQENTGIENSAANCLNFNTSQGFYFGQAITF